jgi:hypothetical protein
MAKWFKENATLLSALAFLVASWIFGFGSFVALLAAPALAAHNARGWAYGLFAVFLAGLGGYQLRRWDNQRQLAWRPRNPLRFQIFIALAAAYVAGFMADRSVDSLAKGSTVLGVAGLFFVMLLAVAAIFLGIIASRAPAA